MKKIVIAYYTHSGNTEKVARLIAEATGGDLHPIEPETAYPTDYNTVVKQAKAEIQAGTLPKLKNDLPNLSAYDTIIVGTPNWWSTLAPPVSAFLKGHELAGKTVMPFCTHGGGGLAKVEQDMRALCPGATVLSSLALSGSGGAGARDKVAAWLAESR